MKKYILLLIFCLNITLVKSQLYFPSNNQNQWDTIPPSSLGWCQNKIDSLYTFLDTNNTKAFILLKDGKIVLEKYFNGHSESANWYWASAGKTITAFMVGIAQQENFLHISDTTSKYLGQGWTSCTIAQEEKITILNQLTMTTGLEDGLDPHCTIDTCLIYRANSGTRWAYHNAPYTLLDGVIANATGQSLNLYTNSKLKIPTGMNGIFIQQGFNNVYFSTARSMARFGLLILNQGKWNTNQILTDTSYFNDMVSTSQNLNEAYGYLWWLNGTNTFMAPQSQWVFNSSISPDAPSDMIAALGKDGQILTIIPSQNIVMVRMGGPPNNSLVPFTLNIDIWKHLNEFQCSTVDIPENKIEKFSFRILPNPCHDFLSIEITNRTSSLIQYSVYTSSGKLIRNGNFNTNIYNLNTSEFKSGIYLLQLSSTSFTKTFKFIKQ